MGDDLLPGAESASHRRKHEPLVADTDEPSQRNTARQQYQGISAETVRVGANKM